MVHLDAVPVRDLVAALLRRPFLRRRVATAPSAPIEAARPRLILLVPPRPVGLWRCTVSTFPEFVVGESYFCLPDGGRSPRIYPDGLNRRTGCWAPYWSAGAKRFCYPRSELDFVFVRPLDATEIAALHDPRRLPAAA